MSLRNLAFAVILSAGGCCTMSDGSKAETGSHGGPYAGITIGYASQTLATPGIDLSGQGMFGGAYVGAGLVTPGGLYLGIEGDVTLRDVQTRVGNNAFALEAGADWMATVRGRVGVPFGPVLPYLTAGLAIQESKVSVTGLGSATELQYGLAAGGGMDLNITKTMHIRLEAMHFAFPSESYTLGGLSTGNIEQGETVVRVGLGFRLN